MRARTVVDHDGYVHRSRVIHDTPCGKNAYATRKLAKTVARQQAKESGENLEAYHCYVCHAHHVGHPPGEPRQLSDARDD